MISPESYGDEPDVMMDINTTPLIDVMLVLLVMLIITIPVQLHAVRMDLPVRRDAAASAPPQQQRIDIDAKNQIFWNGNLIEAAALDAELQRIGQTQAVPDLLLRTDKSASYAVFAAVLASTRRSGLSRVAVIGSEQFVQ